MAARRVAFALIFFPLITLYAQPDRISSPIENHRTVVLKGHLNPHARLENDRGALEARTPIHDVRLVLRPSEQQAAELEQFLEEQRDPSSANYQHWLTPEEFGERFGLSENDLGKITSWLQSQGFTVDRVARARNWITFSGSAEQIGRTFGTELHRYNSGGDLRFANITEPSIPEALAGVVSGMRGLDDFRPKPPVHETQSWLQPLRRPPASAGLSPDFNGSGSAHYLAPDDLTTIYDIAALYKAGFDGTGQKLVIAGQTDLKVSDITAFRTQFNLPSKPPQTLLYGADPGMRTGDAVEADLDVEWAGAIARNATIIYVYSQNVFESVQYAIDQNLAPVISLSYGTCESGIPNTYRTMAQQANAQGITWMSASGDSGAAGCDPQGSKAATQGPAVTFPANIPEVTAVGGTEFSDAGGTFWTSQEGPNGGSAISYIPEKAWNDTSTGGGIEGSGGGASIVYSKPWWQTGPGVPNDQARDLPDVSLSASAAHDGFIICSNGSLMVVGGTSASTPSFAGIVALVNQYVVAKGIQPKAGLGNINPTLYRLAQGTAGVFHDVTAGDNIVPCTTGTPGCVSGSFGYKAGPGYDLVTGLGSVDAYKLVMNWASLPPSVGTTMTLTASPSSIAQSATVQLIATVKAVSGSNPPTGSVIFSDGTASLGSATVVPGTGSTGTATIPVNGSALQSGANTITAIYTAAGNFASSTGSATVSVTPPPPVGTTTTVAANPPGIASSGTTQLTATVKPASGTVAPTGSVKFATGNTVLGIVTLTASGASSTAALTVKGTSLTVGNNTISASYVGASSGPGNFTNSTASVTVNVTSPPSATITTLTANPATIASTGTTLLTATVIAATGSTTPTGIVTFSVGNTVLGSLSLSNGTASLTVKGSSLAIGANLVTATYAGVPSAAVTVTVTSPLVATTTSVIANPASISATGTTQLTATIKPASGSASPTGTVSFTLGNTALGSLPLSNGTASLIVRGSSLAPGNNMIAATYSGAASFAASTGSVTLTVTGPATSKVLATVTPQASSTQVKGWLVKVQLQEQAGVATTLTGFTINGTDYSSLIPSAFGTTQLAAHGTLTANLAIQWSPLPATIVFGFSGIDTGGTKWSQSASAATAK